MEFYDTEDGNFSLQTETSPLLGRKAINDPCIEESKASLKEISDTMRKKLSDFFMNTKDKWSIRKKFPWKLCVQVAIVITCAVQMSIFGFYRINHLKANMEMTATLNHVFLKNWTPLHDGNAPPIGPYAVYTAPDFYSHVDYVVSQYMKIRSLTAESYGYDSLNSNSTPMRLCILHYSGYIKSGNLVEGIDGSPLEICVQLPTNGSKDGVTVGTFSSESLLRSSNYSLNFGTLIKAKLSFHLKTAILKSVNEQVCPECYKVNLKIIYDNTENVGPILISFKVQAHQTSCQLRSADIGEEDHLDFALRQFLNISIVLLSGVSMALCLRSIYKGCRLCHETIWFFKYYHDKDIPFWEKLDFIDFWYVVIIIGDTLLLSGSILKFELEEGTEETLKHTTCSLLLGVGYLLVLFGTLRYFKFFPRYNVLIITLKKAVPNVLRFLICIFFLFVGYCFCGWIVLSPYHSKFISFSTTAEGLFADMNGDDVYGSFNMLTTDQNLIWWFSRIYLYSFFFLFMYLAASLLVSVIMDAFESVKYAYQHGEMPSTTVERFLANDEEDFSILSTPSEMNVSCRRKHVGYINSLLIWLK